MPLELEDRTAIVNNLYDGQPFTLCHDPVVFQPRDIERATMAVFGTPYASPGFRALQKLAICQSLISGKEIAEPFTSQKYLDEEIRAKNNPWLPTVGVELEIPYEVDFKSEQKPPYLVLDYLGIPHSLDCRWEFILPYSYSWKTQASILHHLLELQFIPYKQANWQSGPRGRYVAEADYFSLHYNLGIPADTKNFPENENSNAFSNDVHYLAKACGLAFSSPLRLLKRKTTTDATMDKGNEESKKTLKRNQFGRVEIRTLGFGNNFSYKQLFLIQEIGSAFLAYYRNIPASGSKLDEQHQRLYDSWAGIRLELREIMDERYHITSVFNRVNETSSLKLEKILHTTDVQQEMLKYLLSKAAEIRAIIRS